MIGLVEYEDARAVAEEFLDREFRSESDEEVVIVDGSILETADAWIFPFENKLYLETRDYIHALIGNGPLVVPKDGAEPWMPFGNPSLEEQIPGLAAARVVFGADPA